MKPGWKEWTFTLVAFVLSGYIYSLFSYWGVANFLKEGMLPEYFSTFLWHVEIILVGLIFGSLFVLINIFSETQYLRQKSFGFNILLKSGLYFLALAIVTGLLLSLFMAADWVEEEDIEEFSRNISPLFIVSTLIFTTLQVTFFNFVRYMGMKFGTETLIDLMTGKYHRPRNLDLAFMFLDLKNSTAYAEKLGNETYSSFINECVHMLSPFIIRSKAHVYQYVGDGVILYWNTRRKNWASKACSAYFDYQTKLKTKESYYLNKYGVVPGFKGGMDCGTVTATEVGDLKRDIAFHGDVLNTAARLEGKCNEYNAGLIISENVLSHLSGSTDFETKFLSDLPLKGKSEKVPFYEVKRKLGV